MANQFPVILQKISKLIIQRSSANQFNGSLPPGNNQMLLARLQSFLSEKHLKAIADVRLKYVHKYVRYTFSSF